MQHKSNERPSDVVKAARKALGETQIVFSRRFGIAQSLISKYEAGLVAPPADLIIHCMNILGGSTSPSVTEGMLLSLIRQRLSGPHMAVARIAVAQLIQALVPAGGARESNDDVQLG